MKHIYALLLALAGLSMPALADQMNPLEAEQKRDMLTDFLVNPSLNSDPDLLEGVENVPDALSAQPEKAASSAVATKTTATDTSKSAAFVAALKKAREKSKILAESLIEYANQGGKILANLPKIIEKTKDFINTSISILALVKTDLQHIKTQLNTIKTKQDNTEKLILMTQLLESALLPLINHLAELMLAGAKVVYTNSDATVEPLNSEIATKAKTAALSIRDIAKEVDTLTKDLETTAEKIEQTAQSKK